MDRLNADLDRGSAEMDRLIAGIWRPGDLRLVDILTLVWPPVWVVVDGGGAGLLRVGDGDGLDLLGVEVDLEELGDGAANLKREKKLMWNYSKFALHLQFFFQGYLHQHSVWRNKIWLSTTAFLNVFDLSMRTLYCSMYQIFFSCEKFVKLLKFQRTVQSQFYWLEIFLKFRKSQHYCAVSSSHIELKIENIA